MQQWEYDVMELPAGGLYPAAAWVEALNAVGKAGWEVIAMKTIDGTRYVFLKRPKPP